MFDETIPEKIKMDAIISTSSLPMIFPPVNIGQMTLIDGGTFTNINMGAAINRCREEVEDKDIIVDAVMNFDSPPEFPVWSYDQIQFMKTYHMVRRLGDFWKYY